jgi:hypothetical protein
MAKSKEKFSAQADPKLLKTVRAMAKTEGRQLHSLIDEALADLIEKRKHGSVRAKVISHYEASLKEYGSLYERLAK